MAQCHAQVTSLHLQHCQNKYDDDDDVDTPASENVDCNVQSALQVSAQAAHEIREKDRLKRSSVY